MGFSRFWEVKIIIFGHFGSPGPPFGGVFSWRGSISKIFGLDQNLTTDPLLGVLDFGCFFEVSFYQFFSILGGRRLHFRLHFGTFWEAPGSP